MLRRIVAYRLAINTTRVDTNKLTKAVNTANDHLDAAAHALEQYLVLLTNEGRAHTLRVRKDFPAAARKLADAVGPHADIVGATDFDADAVREDLDNVELLASVEQRVTNLARLLSDSRLTWRAEAFVPSLQVYGVANVRAKNNAALQQAIAPLARVFATRRRAPLPTEPKRG